MACELFTFTLTCMRLCTATFPPHQAATWVLCAPAQPAPATVARPQYLRHGYGHHPGFSVPQFQMQKSEFLALHSRGVLTRCQPRRPPIAPPVDSTLHWRTPAGPMHATVMEPVP